MREKNSYDRESSFSIIGFGGHGRVIVEVALLLGKTVKCIYDDKITKEPIFYRKIQVIGPIGLPVNTTSIIAIGDNKVRKEISGRYLFNNWTTLIHPSAIISSDVQLGEGTVVMAGAIIQPGVRVGKHCIINTGACIDHDCFIDDFAHVAPNCSIAGGVLVGEGSFVGIGTSIIPNKVIGKWTNVGAGSVVIDDQPDYCTTVGVPARPIKYNNE